MAIFLTSASQPTPTNRLRRHWRMASLPATSPYWELFPPLTPFTDFTPELNMYGSAYSSETGTWSQTISTDSVVYLLTDFTNSNTHMNVSLGTTDQTYFSISEFEQISGAVVFGQVPCPGPGGSCYPQSIAVGPNQPPVVGAPFASALGQNSNGSGDYYIYQWLNSQWGEIPFAGTQIASSPEGYLWVVNHLGQIFHSSEFGFEEAPGNGCATAIGVGPASASDPYGTPWVIGCNGSASQNGGI